MEHLPVRIEPSPVELIRVSLVEHSQCLVLRARFYSQVWLRSYPKVHFSNDLVIIHPAQLQQFYPPIFHRLNDQIAAVCFLDLKGVLIKTEVFLPQMVVFVEQIRLHLILFAFKDQYRRVISGLYFCEKALLRILKGQHQLRRINFHLAHLEHLNETVLVDEDLMPMGVKETDHLLLSLAHLAVDSWTGDCLNHLRSRRVKNSNVQLSHNNHNFFLPLQFLFVLIQNFE